MNTNLKILNAVKFAGGLILLAGIILFAIGLFESRYSILVSIGTGTIIGAVFIFLMGVFLVITEELVEKKTNRVRKTEQ
ncbi:hypothetical protein SAMN05421676_11267 [Salinibacillus kushneri]|uniref:Uncharacterized protein n=1 Tax=Salinibacillus kushneri TaxID=237682 RepID=A0A1I0IG75_9BACI|nr:hypothetical protein [Salinibacillus kushneri]SET95945.1 hypothetical protein SAMN05421676_11267 [Salinibacillus kushneri]